MPSVMTEIYLVVRKIGDFENTIAAYQTYGAAEVAASKALTQARDKGYTDFRYIVKPIPMYI